MIRGSDDQMNAAPRSVAWDLPALRRSSSPHAGGARRPAQRHRDHATRRTRPRDHARTHVARRCPLLGVHAAAPDLTILYLHGGGYRLGSAEQFAAVATRIAVAARARVISVDDRLAPEHPFPAATPTTPRRHGGPRVGARRTRRLTGRHGWLRGRRPRSRARRRLHPGWRRDAEGCGAHVTLARPHLRGEHLRDRQGSDALFSLDAADLLPRALPHPLHPLRSRAVGLGRRWSPAPDRPQAEARQVLEDLIGLRSDTARDRLPPEALRSPQLTDQRVLHRLGQGRLHLCAHVGGAGRDGDAAEGRELIHIIGDAGLCATALDALEAAGYDGPITSISACIDEATVASAGEYLEGVQIAYNATTEATDADYQTFLAVVDTSIGDDDVDVKSPAGVVRRDPAVGRGGRHRVPRCAAGAGSRHHLHLRRRPGARWTPRASRSSSRPLTQARSCTSADRPPVRSWATMM